MSIRFMSRVWALAGLTATEKIVLLKFCDHVDDTGHNAYPSIRTVALAVSLSERQVQRIVRRLAKPVDDGGLGLMGVQTAATAHRTCTYFVSLPAALPLADLLTSGVTSTTPGVTSTTRGVTPMSPDPSLNRPGTKEQAAAPPLPLLVTVENPDDNVRVITRIAHEVIDVVSERAAATDIAEGVKTLCARRKIQYNGAAVKRAIDSALWQRRPRAGAGAS